MKRILIILFLFLSLALNGATYYVAPTGSNAAAGTLAAPWATLPYAVTRVIAGDTVYFRGGTYTLSSQMTISLHGTASDPICFFNYPGEVPIWDAIGGLVNGAGFFLNSAEYVELKGLQVRNILQTNSTNYACGFYAYYSSHITFRNLVAHDIGVRCFQFYNPDTIYVYDCDAYNVCDSLSAAPGNAGDGFIATGTHNAIDTLQYIYFHGCRAWHTSDDGWDTHIEGRVDMDSCWSIRSGGYRFNYGNGFKMGLSTQQTQVGLARKYTHNVAIYSRGAGFVTNDNNASAKRMNIYNNISYHNTYGFYIYNTSGTDANELRRIFRNNIAYSNTAEIATAGIGALYTHDHNSWDIPLTFTSGDFISIDTTGITGVRQSNGNLPSLNFLKPTSASQGINQGVDVGLSYGGDAPDLGAYEYALGDPVIPPYVATGTPTGISMMSATGSGIVTYSGGATVTDRGLCWGLTTNPVITDNHVHCGSGMDSFTGEITGLVSNTIYHVRSFATNLGGTSYGADVTFTTKLFSHISNKGKKVVSNGHYLIIR
jgi:hypothetical protein